MRTARLHDGDLVEVNVRGLVFRARVVDTDPRDWAQGFLEVESLHAGYRGYRFVKAREIRKLLERARRRRAAA